MSEPQHISDVIAPMFRRGDLPERIATMDPVPRAGLRRGDVLTWDTQRRAYVTPGGRFLVLADYVRRNWLIEFCWPGPEQLELRCA